MMTNPKKSLLALLGAVSMLLTLTGCYDLEKRITWSADGQTLAAIGEEGLRLAELDGELSEVLIAGARMAEWVEIGGEEKLVVWRYRPLDRWPAIEKVLVEEVRTAVVAEGDAIVAALRSGAEWTEHLRDDSERKEDWVLSEPVPWEETVRLYVISRLSEQELAPIQQQVGPKNFPVNIAEITVYPRQAGLALGAAEYVSPAFLGSTDEMRISSAHGGHAAFVIADDEVSDGLWIAALAGDGPRAARPWRVETGLVGLFPDWTADGQWLAYTKPERPIEDSNTIDVSLGYLVTRRILDEQGKRIEAEDEQDEEFEERKAWLLFYAQGRVRCLADGRILCSAIEAHFPATEADLPQGDQLYQFDPKRPATLSRMLPSETLANLPDMIALYEVSPDGKRMAIIDPMESFVSVVDLASGELFPLQEEDLTDIAWMPSWTSDGQLCYRGRLPRTGEEEEADAPKKKIEVILWDGTNYRAISEGWPKDLRDSLDLSRG